MPDPNPFVVAVYFWGNRLSDGTYTNLGSAVINYPPQAGSTPWPNCFREVYLTPNQPGTPLIPRILNSGLIFPEMNLTIEGVEFNLPANFYGDLPSLNVSLPNNSGGQYHGYVYYSAVPEKGVLSYSLDSENEKYLVIPAPGMEFSYGEDLNLYFETKPEFQIKEIILDGNSWTPPIVGNNQSAIINFGSYYHDVVLKLTARSVWEYAQKFRIHGITLSGLDKVTDWIPNSGGSGSLEQLKYKSFYLEGEDGKALNPGTYNLSAGGKSFSITVMGNQQFSSPIGEEILISSGGQNITVNSVLDEGEPDSPPDPDPPFPQPPDDGSGQTTPTPQPAPLPVPAPPYKPPVTPVPQPEKTREETPFPPSPSSGCLDPCMQDIASAIKYHGTVTDKRLGQLYEGMVAGFEGICLRLDRIQQSQGFGVEKMMSFGDDLDDILENFFNEDSPDYSSALAEIKGELEGINEALHVEGDVSGDGIADREQVIMVDGLEIRTPRIEDEG